MEATVAAQNDALGPHAANSAKLVRRRPSLLVAIASYGTAQDHFLHQVVAQFQGLDMACRIVVLSNIDKPVPGAEVRVGLPSRDTYSLPFAHRRLFLECAKDFDLFIYTEDDTLITPDNIRAFLEVQQHLKEDEIAGFLRSETSPEGTRYIVSANSHFRWAPDSGFSRGNYHFAQFSNQHSGCFIATRDQLARAISSGGFTVEPRADRYGMLETAASDIYTQCGLKRVICLTRVEEFIVPHLANKYHGTMGIPVPEFEAQMEALCALGQGGARTASLFNPETSAPGFRWSKHLYQASSKRLIALVPSSARRVLSVGATMGHDEIELQRRGFEVCAVPLDAVFGTTLSRRGLKVHVGRIEDVLAQLGDAKFDVVFAADMLHLVSQPLDWIRALSKLLSPSGEIVGSVSHTSSWLWPIKDWRRGRRRWTRPSFDRNGAQPMSERRLARLCSENSLELADVVPSTEESPGFDRAPWRWARRKLAPKLLFRIRRSR